MKRLARRAAESIGVCALALAVLAMNGYSEERDTVREGVSARCGSAAPTPRLYGLKAHYSPKCNDAAPYFGI